ncbi:MAG: SufD family Fe-S cluster assembly protein, partial [Acidaminococcaceae bacterium]|nr:SufD family Fe-S cluster assembly protein [Acidaminococcaceae bacterium]
GKDAKIYVTAVEAGASHSVTKLQVDLLGDGSAADVAAVYFGDQARKLDLNYVINQIGKNTDANMQVRGALQDASDKIFRGTLDFRRGSKGSSGREREEVILFNEGVRNRSVPLMLSSEDEVTGHHAVSAGRMNREKLFYLMSRGLDEKEARKLLAQAMLTPVLERIPDIALQEEITDNIEERISDGQS